MTTPGDDALTRRPEQMPVLRPDDERLHPMLQHVLEQGDATGMGRFLGGLRLPFMSAKFLMRHRELWTTVIWPVIINFGLVLGALYFIVPWGISVYADVWSQPAGQGIAQWLLSVVWHLGWAVSAVISAIVSYITAVLVGGVVASPFNDVISDKTERVLLGEHYQEPEEGSLVAGTVYSIGSSAAMVTLYGAAMIPLLFLNLIPGIGSVAYTVLASVVGGFFLALEYSDTLMARKMIPFRKKVSMVWRERTFAVGFGVGTSFTLAIPLINFLCIPLAVIGGTAVGVGVTEWDRHPPKDDAPKQLP